MQTILAIQFLKKLTTEQIQRVPVEVDVPVGVLLPGTLEETMLAAVESCTVDHPDFIKKSFQTTLRYMLLYAAGLNGIEAKQATVISNKRQATLKV